MIDKFIIINDKALCSGCNACTNVCPVDVISMQEDEEGFLYPVVDTDNCIKCSKCLKVCPYIKSEFTLKPDSEELSKCYAAYNKNEEVRAQSSSGGMFRVFADKILSENGVVFGAAFDDKFEVEHQSARTGEDVTKLMGSKYLQSRMGMVCREVEEILKKGDKVLFTGVACQIAGLKRYLRKDYENLVCVDVLCCSVGSPKIWREYLKNFFPNSRIDSVKFRDKITGWDSTSMRITSGGKEYADIIYKNLYFKSLRANVFTRPACENCQFKNKNRVSDITLADCWGWKKIAPELNDNRGLSSIVVHTEKGIDLLNAVREQLVIKDTFLTDIEAFNSNYICSESYDKIKRAAFWKDYKKMAFKSLIMKYANENKKKVFLRKIKNISGKLLPATIRRVVKLTAKSFVYPYSGAKQILSEDKKFNETFRFDSKQMPRSFKSAPEWKIIVLYRKYQANSNNIFGMYYKYKLDRQGCKTGIDFGGNVNIGKGLIIGHYGRIVINGAAKFGEQIYLTHGVTIGRNAVGRKKGVPTFGNRVRIGANAIIVGNVTIGDDVCIAPGAFVNFDVPSHSVVFGNPGQIHHKDNATDGYLGTL
jgi:serine acetyltransferase/coenzyme F420-reducing hydrogenase beta subunit